MAMSLEEKYAILSKMILLKSLYGHAGMIWAIVNKKYYWS